MATTTTSRLVTHHSFSAHRALTSTSYLTKPHTISHLPRYSGNQTSCLSSIQQIRSRSTRQFSLRTSSQVITSLRTSRWQTSGSSRARVDTNRVSPWTAYKQWVRLASSDSQDMKNKTTLPPSTLSKINPLTTTTTKSQLPERHEKIWNIPNILTFTRLFAAPLTGYLILTSQPVWALSLFFYAGITDLIDGYLARKLNAQTVLGTVIDPMADKALMTIVVVCTTLQGILPLWLAVIILGRDAALAISAIYFRYISLPPPKTMARFWDFSLPSAEVHPTEISKINTMLQLLLVGNAMVLPVLPEAVVELWNLGGVFEGWQYLVAGTTVWSGLSYISNRDAVKILSVEEAKAKEREMIEMRERQKERRDGGGEK